MTEQPDDGQLREILAAANIPTLLTAIVQLSGDYSWLDHDEKPSRGDIDGTRKMSATRQQAIRDAAFSLLKATFSGQRQVPERLPDPSVMQKLASGLVGETVPSEYVPMLLEDAGFTDSSLSRVAWSSAAPSAQIKSSRPKVAIVGGGLSGLCAAVMLKRLDIEFTIFEKNDSLAGTWYENNYPNCGVDTPNHFYSFSFAPNNAWSSFYSKRDELYQYILGVAEQYQINPHVLLKTEVLELNWQETSRQWQVVTKDTQGAQTSAQFNHVISAVGQLNQPKVPKFPGANDFEGSAFHSARWPKQIDLTGKRVGVIGTGASAMQLAPAVAEQAAKLTIFQRSPHWIRVLPDYHRKVSPHKRWLLDHFPFYRNWYRFKLFWVYGDGIWESIHKDPEWPHGDRSLNADNERHREIYVRNLREALDNDEALLAKVVPSYPPFAKRMLIDNNWCEMLKRDNVELICAGTSQIQRNGVIDALGGEHPLDVLIYATGFQAHRFLFPLTVRGSGTKTLDDTWGDDAQAYLGMTTPNFPNLFFLYGPNTNLGHGGSHIFNLECQVRYIAQTIIAMAEAGQSRIEVKTEACEAYNRRVDAEHEQMVWTHGDVDNWYKNSRGRVVSNIPWRLVDYWHMTHSPDLSDYRLAE